MSGKSSTYRIAFLAPALLLAASCLAAGASAEAPAGPAQSAATTLPASAGMLWADDFWTTCGNVAEHPLDQASLAELRRLAVAAETPAIRLRAIKLLCDIDGHSRVDPSFKKEQAPRAIAGAFTWLEAHLADPEVAKYAPAAGFTHMTISRMADDKEGVWVLIETAANRPAFNGGLNIRFDPKTGTVSEVKHWGDVRGK